MCWRDEVPMTRVCMSCDQEYFGNLGHKSCPELSRARNLAERLSDKSSEKPVVCDGCKTGEKDWKNHHCDRENARVDGIRTRLSCDCACSPF